MATFARRIVEQNGYSDVIEVINSRVEAAEIPEKVDIVISEWMGTLLIFEAMIESVLWARDAHLKPVRLVSLLSNKKPSLFAGF